MLETNMGGHLVQRKLVRAIGVSNFSIQQIRELLPFSKIVPAVNQIVLGVSSFLLKPMCGKRTARVVWVISNFTVALSLAAMLILSVVSRKNITAQLEVSLLQALTSELQLLLSLQLLVFLFFIPFPVTATVDEGGDQGLCIGFLNISIVIPQQTYCRPSSQIKDLGMEFRYNDEVCLFRDYC